MRQILGLAMSILLFARVAYEQSYDTCFRDYDRIYQVWSMFILNNEKNEPQNMNMGPLAGAIHLHQPLPGVVAALLWQPPLQRV